MVFKQCDFVIWFVVQLILLSLFSCSHRCEERKTLYVMKVADGDTFTGLTADNRQVKIRIAGIDAPEKGQPYGNKAKKALAAMVFHKSVAIDSLYQDRYGRTIAVVYTPKGKDVGAELIKQGMAWHYVQYSHDKQYAQLEQKARDQHMGLWQYHDIISPWQWRKMSKEERDMHR